MDTMNYSRRKFAKNIATIVAGSTMMNPFLAASARSNKNKLGIALVGMGYYATQELAPALQKTNHCYLSGFVTGTPEKEKIYGEKYNIPKKNIYNYDNYDTIANNPEIDIIYVVLPNSMHKEYTIRAAKAGKHVICEKPMAMNAQEAREMIQACEEEDVSLSIGYRLQYEPYTQKIMQFAKEKPWGDINFVNTSAGFYMKRPTDHWKVKAEYGGGAMMDMGPYPVQAARYSTGLEPIAVTAQQFVSDPEVFRGVDETTTFQLEFPGNIIANCMTTFRGNVNYLKVNARDGKYGLEPFSWYDGLHGYTPEGNFDFPKMNQQAAQMDGMCLSIMEGRPSRTPGEEGLRDMIITDAVKESIRQGGKRIVLS
ncbi:MAG: Gfo/Idh/MocA family protein [Bacteroidota bacterium]